MNNIDKGRLKIELLEDMKRRPHWYLPELLTVLFYGVKDLDLLEKIKNSETLDPLLRSFILSNQTLKHEDLVNAIIIPEYLSVETLLKPEIGISSNNKIDNNQECIDVIFLGEARSGKSIVSASIMERLSNNGLGCYRFSPITNRYYYDLLSCFQERKFACSTAYDALHYALYYIPKRGNLRIIDPGDNIIRHLKDLSPKYLKSNNKKILFFIVDTMSILQVDGYEWMWNDFKECLNNCIHNLCDNVIDEADCNGCTMSNVTTIILLFTKFDIVNFTNKLKISEWIKKQVEEKLLNEYHYLERICHQYAINSEVGYKPIIMKYSVGKVYIGNTFDYDPKDAQIITDFILSKLPYKYSEWDNISKRLNSLKG